ncbi:MAG: hypothetical protein H7A51_06605 [Akkermansiaceae bacterium]|nr:hypothetical protein [Akkermansiaceae bacterium]
MEKHRFFEVRSSSGTWLIGLWKLKVIDHYCTFRSTLGMATAGSDLMLLSLSRPYADMRIRQSLNSREPHRHLQPFVQKQTLDRQALT